MRKFAIVTALAAALASLPALASDDDKGCTKAPKDTWMTTDALKSKLGAEGYTVNKIETEGNCIEAEVRDKDGRSAELYLDPATGNVVEREDD